VVVTYKAGVVVSRSSVCPRPNHYELAQVASCWTISSQDDVGSRDRVAVTGDRFAVTGDRI